MIFKRRQARKQPFNGKIFLRKLHTYSRIFIILAFIVLSIYGLYYAIYLSSFFKINLIKVTGVRSFVNITDITEVAKENVIGSSIFTVNSVKTQNKLMETFQGAEEIKVIKKYPSTINVKVRERSPVALVHHTNSDDYFLVDGEGYILGIIDRERTNLPEITYEGEIKVGTFVDKRMVPLYMELVNSLNEEKLKVSSMSFYPKYALVYINDGIETFISNDRDKSESVRTASALIKQLVLEGKKIKKIDLRYDKVIVSYE